MGSPACGIWQAIALVALMGAFAYGFTVRVSKAAVAAATVATLGYAASVAPEILLRYRFTPTVVLAAAMAGVLGLAFMVWVFGRWPVAIAPALAVLAAIRAPIPVMRSGIDGAADEYVFLLVPLYAATVAALVVEAWRDGSAEQPPLWRRDPLRLPVVSVAVWAGLSTLYSPGEVHAAVRLYSFWLLLPAAYHVVWRALRCGTPRPGSGVLGRWWLTVRAMVITATALGTLGVVQHFAKWSIFRNTNVESSEWQQVIYRVNGIFWDPNVFARYLIVCGLLAGALWLAAGACRRVGAGGAPTTAGAAPAGSAAAAGDCLGLPLWSRWLVLGLLPMAMALYFTYSRSGWLVAVLAVALAAWSRLGWKRALAVLVVLTLVLTASLLLVRSPRYRKTTMQLFEATLGIVKNGRLELATPVNKLTGGRYGLVEGGLAMFAARPVAGWGLGSFPTVYPEYRPPDAPSALRESHNSAVTVAAEMGAIGLALLAWTIVIVVRLVWQSFIESEGARHVFATAVAGGLFAILAHSFLYAALIEDPFTWVLAALIPVGVTAAALGSPAGRRAPGPTLSSGAPAGVPAGAGHA